MGRWYQSPDYVWCGLVFSIPPNRHISTSYLWVARDAADKNWHGRWEWLRWMRDDPKIVWC